MPPSSFAARAGLTLWEGLAVYADRRVLAVLLLGFSSGLPLLLTASTLAARLSESGFSLGEIGIAGTIAGAYSLKVLWSPLVDALPLPPLTTWLGQRRGWLLASQIALIASLLALGAADPMAGTVLTIAAALAVAMSSATQDIVIDALRVELLDDARAGAGAGALVLGYRVGMVAAGGGALVLADAIGWQGAYTAMAGLMVVGVLTGLLLPRPLRGEGGSATAPVEESGAAAWLRRAVVAPLADFTRRPYWLLILAFIALYKYGDAMLGLMATPFYLEIGFTKTQIGLISKSYGMAMTIVGGLAGGVVVARLGIMRALLACGVAQALSNLAFVWLAVAGPDEGVLIATISIEAVTSGLGTTAFVAYLSSLCSVAFTATQYALVSSLMALARTTFTAGGGYLAEALGWPLYFTATAVAALPGLLLLLWMMRAFPAASGESPLASAAGTGK